MSISFSENISETDKNLIIKGLSNLQLSVPISIDQTKDKSNASVSFNETVNVTLIPSREIAGKARRPKKELKPKKVFKETWKEIPKEWGSSHIPDLEGIKKEFSPDEWYSDEMTDILIRCMNKGCKQNGHNMFIDTFLRVIPRPHTTTCMVYGFCINPIHEKRPLCQVFISPNKFPELIN